MNSGLAQVRSSLLLSASPRTLRLGAHLLSTLPSFLANLRNSCCALGRGVPRSGSLPLTGGETEVQWASMVLLRLSTTVPYKQPCLLGVGTDYLDPAASSINHDRNNAHHGSQAVLRPGCCLLCVWLAPTAWLDRHHHALHPTGSAGGALHATQHTGGWSQDPHTPRPDSKAHAFGKVLFSAALGI